MWGCTVKKNSFWRFKLEFVPLHFQFAFGASDSNRQLYLILLNGAISSDLEQLHLSPFLNFVSSCLTSELQIWYTC